jgi:hypothetical protein
VVTHLKLVSLSVAALFFLYLRLSRLLSLRLPYSFSSSHGSASLSTAALFFLCLCLGRLFSLWLSFSSMALLPLFLLPPMMCLAFPSFCIPPTALLSPYPRSIYKCTRQKHALSHVCSIYFAKNRCPFYYKHHLSIDYKCPADFSYTPHVRLQAHLTTSSM